MTQAAHAKYAPSSSARWIPCPGSVHTQTPEDSGDEARLGTEIHDIAAEGPRADYHPRHWGVDEIEIADTCLSEWWNRVPREAQAEVRLHSLFAPDEFFGTVDALVVAGDTAKIWDLKTGMQRVPSFENSQMLCYLLLVAENYPDVNHFEATIIQPRLRYYETVEYSREEIVDFRGTVLEAMRSVELAAGPHCTFCPLAEGCVVLFDYLREGLMQDNTLEKAKWLLRHKKVIESQIEGAKKVLRGKLKSGETIEGFTLKRGRRLREWGVDEEEIIRYLTSVHFLDDADAEEILYHTGPRSVAQVEKILKSKGLGVVPEEIIDYTDSEPTVVTTELPEFDGSEFDS